ncbi:MAG: hypothetical protein ACERLG_12245 [Sedimentibacter sp.]
MSWDRIETYKSDAYGARSFDKKLLDDWLEGKNITRWVSGGEHDVPKFLRTGRSNIGFPNHNVNKPPYLDHVAYFKETNPLKVWLVYHPYKDIESIKDEIEEWTILHDLKVNFYDSGKSWYNKNNTSMIVITTK